MANLSTRLLAGVAVLCSTAGVAGAVPEYAAQEFLVEAEAVAARVTRCPAAADDLVGETALRLLTRHEGIMRDDEKGGRRGYVQRCVQNAYRDELRRNARQRSLSEFDEDPPEVLWLSAPPDGAANIEIEEFQSLLSTEDLVVLELLEEGCRERQIASRTNQTRHFVRRSIARIRDAASSYFRPAASA